MLFSAASSRFARISTRRALHKPFLCVLPKVSSFPGSAQTRASLRTFSSTDTHEIDNTFDASPPSTISTEMAKGIADSTQFYVRYGLSHRRLLDLAKETDIPVVLKWQKMMEIFLTTQVHVIAGLGYKPDEDGLSAYARDLGACIQKADDESQEILKTIRRDTWREIVATCFYLDVSDIPILSVVDARNLMHKVSSRMIEPDVLLDIQTQTAKIKDSDVQIEVAKKHQVLQNVIVNHVYLGGSPSLVEEAGFGKGEQGYAKLQCAMSDHEGDPLIAQYASSSMIKIWDAAGLDLSSIQGPGMEG